MGGLLFPELSDEDIQKLNHYDNLLKLVEAYRSIIESYKRANERLDEILKGTLDAFRQLQGKHDLTEDEKKHLAENINNLIAENNKQKAIISKNAKLISKKKRKAEDYKSLAEPGKNFKGQQVSNENKRLYIPIFQLFLKYQEEYPKRTLREAVWNKAKYSPGYEDEENKQRLNKFINYHNIATLNQLEKALHLK